MIRTFNKMIHALEKYCASIWLLTQVNRFRSHKNSFLGSAWGLIQPFVHVIIISHVFGILLRQQKEAILLNLVSALPFWNFLYASITNGAMSILSRDYIFRKCLISKSMFPVSDVLLQAYNLLLSFFSMYLAFSILYPNNFDIKVVLIPIFALPLMISVISVTVAVAYLTPYIRDIPQMLSVILNALYWTIPIVYPFELIPEDKRIFFEINPLFILFRPIQVLLSNHQIPSITMMIQALFVALLSILVSYQIFRACRKNVVFYL
jgi:lipopolysaccharide transport system permease protein